MDDNNSRSLCGKDRSDSRACQRIFGNIHVCESYGPHIQEAWSFVFACAWHSYWEAQASQQASQRQMTIDVFYHHLVTNPKEAIEAAAKEGKHKCVVQRPSGETVDVTPKLEAAAQTLFNWGIVLPLPEPPTTEPIEVETLKEYFNLEVTGILTFGEGNKTLRENWSLFFACAWHSYWEALKMPDLRKKVDNGTIKPEDVFFYRLVTDPISAVREAKNKQVEVCNTGTLANQLSTAADRIISSNEYLPLSKPPFGDDYRLGIQTLCQFFDQDGMTGILNYS